MNIKEMSITTGTSPRMLRHYEELGLIKPSRSPSGYRLYSSELREKISYIQSLSSLGLPLKDIKLLILDPTNNKNLIKKLFKTYNNKQDELSKLNYQLDDLKDILKSAHIKPFENTNEIFNNSTVLKDNNKVHEEVVKSLYIDQDKLIKTIFEEQIVEFSKIFPAKIEIDSLEIRTYKDWSILSPKSFIKFKLSKELNKPFFLTFPNMGVSAIDKESIKEINKLNVVDNYYSSLVQAWAKHKLNSISFSVNAKSLSSYKELDDYFDIDDSLYVLKYKINPKIGSRFFYFIFPYCNYR